jgi:hypothetical protein
MHAVRLRWRASAARSFFKMPLVAGFSQDIPHPGDILLFDELSYSSSSCAASTVACVRSSICARIAGGSAMGPDTDDRLIGDCQADARDGQPIRQ